MKLGRLGALINTRGTLGAKPGGVDATRGGPTGRSTKRAKADKRMGEAAAALQKVLLGRGR